MMKVGDLDALGGTVLINGLTCLGLFLTVAGVTLAAIAKSPTQTNDKTKEH
jgi:hypothetical protein